MLLPLSDECISIHALRKESDALRVDAFGVGTDFNPRSP